MLLKIYILIFPLIPSILNIINISNYEYPHPENENSNYYTISIFQTNDIHGFTLPVENIDPRNGEKYLRGGVEYISSYIKILKEEWKERFIWFDVGDSFYGGGFENFVSKGQILLDFYNYNNLSAITFGNHEFNEDVSPLERLMEKSNFDYLVSNMRNFSTGQTEFMPNQKRSKIYQVGKIKLGVIGIAHSKTENVDTRNRKIEFLPYRENIINESNLLKKKGVHVIILIAHFGVHCMNKEGYEDVRILKLRDKNSKNCPCDNYEELEDLIGSFPKRTIDLVLSGHVHKVTHHWIHNIPIMSSFSEYYVGIAYMKFKKIKNDFIYEETFLENPIPLCDKIFNIGKHCRKFTHKMGDNPDLIGNLEQFSFHNKVVKIDNNFSKIIQKWKDMVEQYKTPFFENEIFLTGDKKKENILQNLITDIYRKYTNSDISILNPDNLRAKWYPGKKSLKDLYEMLPFDNILCTFEMNGREIMRMMNDITNELMIYQTSGLIVYYRKNPMRFVTCKIINEKGEIKDIDYNKNYQIAAYDYLIDGNVHFKNVIKWYKKRKYKCGKRGREILKEFLLNKKILKKDEYYLNPKNPRFIFLN